MFKICSCVQVFCVKNIFYILRREKSFNALKASPQPIFYPYDFIDIFKTGRLFGFIIFYIGIISLDFIQFDF